MHTYRTENKTHLPFIGVISPPPGTKIAEERSTNGLLGTNMNLGEVLTTGKRGQRQTLREYKGCMLRLFTFRTTSSTQHPKPDWHQHVLLQAECSPHQDDWDNESPLLTKDVWSRLRIVHIKEAFWNRLSISKAACVDQRWQKPQRHGRSESSLGFIWGGIGQSPFRRPCPSRVCSLKELSAHRNTFG